MPLYERTYFLVSIMTNFLLVQCQRNNNLLLERLAKAHNSAQLRPIRSELEIMQGLCLHIQRAINQILQEPILQEPMKQSR